MKFKDIKRKGMYIVTYNERGFGHLTKVTKMCTKKQFLKELSGQSPKDVTIILNTAEFYAL